MHHHGAGCFVHTFPLFRFVRWYSCHACLCHTLAFYASLHTWLHVHAWVLLASVLSMFQHMKLWTFDPNLYLSLVNTTFCLSSRLFTCFLASLLAMPIMLIYFMPLHMLFASFPSIACPLVSCLCLCMYTHGARMHRARARSPRHKQKGQRYKYIDMSQAAMFNSFKGLASPFFWLCTL